MDTTNASLDYDPTDPWEFSPEVRAQAARNMIYHENKLFDIYRAHGSIEAYNRFVTLERQLDTDRALARSIVSLFRRGHYREVGHLSRHDKQRILQDREITAYFISVAKSGEDGWREEQLRIIAHQRAAGRSHDLTQRLQAFEQEAIYHMIPQWRAWGLQLIQADAVPELDEFVRSYNGPT